MSKNPVLKFSYPNIRICMKLKGFVRPWKVESLRV